MTRTLIVDEPILLFEDSNRELRGNLRYAMKDLSDIKKICIWHPTGYEVIPVMEWVNEQKIRIDPSNSHTLLFRECSLPHLCGNNLFLPPQSPGSYSKARDRPEWLIFSESGRFLELQIVISYETEELMGFSGYKPSMLPRTRNLLENGPAIDIFIFGDSISTGANASGTMNKYPHQLGYPELFRDELHQQFPHCAINLMNRSVGGQTSEWGKKGLKRIGKESKNKFGFHLNIIAWGMNDASGGRKSRDFLRNIQAHVRQLLKINPLAEFIFIASSLPNRLWDHARCDLLQEYAQIIKTYASKLGSRACVADLTAVWTELLQTKNYYDLTGNGLNHPNDYGHRLYAEAILSLISGKSPKAF
jgi:lysophospholipase L1-like esterase